LSKNLKQLFSPRLYHTSILERLRKKEASYKINCNVKNLDATGNKLKEGIKNENNIELAIIEKEKDSKSSLNDKKSRSKSSNYTASRNIVARNIRQEKDKININNNKNDNSNPFLASSNDISEKNYFNDSDRKKLIVSNDISQFENKSDILLKLANSDNNLVFNDTNLNNQSFVKKIPISEEENVIREIKLFSGEKPRIKIRREIKEKKIKKEINKIDLLREDKLKECNLIKKSIPETDEEIVMDLDIEILDSEDDKRIRKVKFNHKIEIKENNENFYENSSKGQANNLIENTNKELNENCFVFEIKEEIYIENNKIMKKDSKEIQSAHSKMENDRSSQDLLQVRVKRSRSILKNKKLNLNEFKENEEKVKSNEIEDKLANNSHFPEELKSENILSSFITYAEEEKESENVENHKGENAEVYVPFEFNRDSFGEGVKINNISDTLLKRNIMQ
jgi:hypothetical protein